MSSRSRVKRGKDKSIFARTAQRTKTLNLYGFKNMRGGIRL